MKTLITFLALLFFTFSASSQTKWFEYTYDDAGNRIKREYFEILRIAPPEDSLANTGEGSEAITTTEQAYTSEQVETAVEEAEPWVIQGGLHTFKLYPNPTQGLIQVEAEDDFMARQNKHAAVHDMNGRLMQALDINTQTFRIDFSAYAAGSYVVKITASGYRKEFVIVKQ